MILSKLSTIRPSPNGCNKYFTTEARKLSFIQQYNHGNYAQYQVVGKTLDNNYMFELLL